VRPRIWVFVTAAAVVAADQITKAIAAATLSDGRSRPVIDGVLHWTLQRNPGAAFGIFRRAPALFTVLAIAISIVIVWSASGARTALHRTALGLVLGGALGNLADRLFRPPGPFRGHVIDFIDFRVWPTFNLADSAVVVGAILLAVHSIVTDRASKRAAARG
jgi:signal peptidase II